ncbi:MAG TPA: hypothetical protein VNT02_00230 [Burkholderiales bacterium]|nr:hypothetical protein [Burkholderiales bacterium]
MASHQVIGIYSSSARARLAQEALILEGMPEELIAISIDLTGDGVAAEAPGQSYTNQPGAGESGWLGSRRTKNGDRKGAGFSDAVQRGTCVVTAEARTSAEVRRVRDIMAALRPLDMRIPAVA